MRARWHLIAILLLVLALAGCSAPTGKPASSDTKATTPGGPGATTTAAPTAPAENAAPVALAPETAGEKTALATAQGAEGRKWATGNPNGTATAEGEPFLVGYGCLVDDGTTSYQLNVYNGTVLGLFGKKGTDRSVSRPLANANAAIAPASARQQAAVDAAVAEIAKTNPNVKTGRIEHYIFFFPAAAGSSYPSVSVYADPSYADISLATGGPYGWPEE